MLAEAAPFKLHPSLVPLAEWSLCGAAVPTAFQQIPM